VPYEPRYIDPDELATAFPQHWLDQMTDDVDGEVTGDAALLAAIRWAETLIDEHLSPRYILPATIDGDPLVVIATEDDPTVTVPDAIHDIATDLVIYRVHQRRFTDKMPDDILSRKNDAMKRLGNIRDGLTRLVIDPVSTAASPGVVVVNVRPSLLGEVRDRYF
jgi:phage gp36-like protein